MSQITPLSDLARGAFNQLLAGTSIDDLLDDAELIELETMLHGKAGDQGLILDGDHLRLRTVLESFLNANAGQLTSTARAGSQVMLEADCVVMLIHLSDIPELIVKQSVPPNALRFLAYVYFTNIGRVA